jgi:hypothetical protein
MSLTQSSSTTAVGPIRSAMSFRRASPLTRPRTLPLREPPRSNARQGRVARSSTRTLPGDGTRSRKAAMTGRAPTSRINVGARTILPRTIPPRTILPCERQNSLGLSEARPIAQSSADHSRNSRSRSVSLSHPGCSPTNMISASAGPNTASRHFSRAGMPDRKPPRDANLLDPVGRRAGGHVEAQGLTKYSTRIHAMIANPTLPIST